MSSNTKRPASSSEPPVDGPQVLHRPGAHERRRLPRVSLELWMEELAEGSVHFRRSGNVSEGGVYFDRAVPHELGTLVTLRFELPGEPEIIIAHGRVVSIGGTADGLGMGIKFVDIEGDGRERIRNYVRDAEP